MVIRSQAVDRVFKKVIYTITHFNKSTEGSETRR